MRRSRDPVCFIRAGIDNTTAYAETIDEVESPRGQATNVKSTHVVWNGLEEVAMENHRYP